MKLYVDTRSEGLTRLNCSKTSYYRWRRTGRLIETMTIIDGKPMLEIAVGESMSEPSNEPTNPFSHARFIDRWIEWRESNIDITAWKPRYKRDQVAYIKRYFQRYDEVTPENLEEWLRGVSSERVTLRRHMHSCVSSMARYLFEKEQILKAEDYERIRLKYPKRPPGYDPEQRIIYDEDITAIRNKLDKYYEGKEYTKLLVETLIIILSETGLRVSELAGMKRNMIRGEYLYLTPDITKNGKGRKVPWHRRADSALKLYLKLRPSTGLDSLFVVQNTKNKLWTPLRANWVTHEFQRLSIFVGIEFSPHSFRHYRATVWANNKDIPIDSVRMWMGHCSVTVTERYIHSRGDSGLQAALA